MTPGRKGGAEDCSERFALFYHILLSYLLTLRDNSQRMYANLTSQTPSASETPEQPLIIPFYRPHQARKRSARRGQEGDWGVSCAEGGGVQGFWGRGTAT